MNKKLPSFNLQEMLIVLAIIGILLLIALPNLMPLITKAKSVEAQTQLKAIYNAEKQYYFMYSKYRMHVHFNKRNLFALQKNHKLKICFDATVNQKTNETHEQTTV